MIGADGITLDLNGHTIDGDGTPAAGCAENEICDVGVLNRGHDGVTVRHGSVRQFIVGPWGIRVSHNRLLGISSAGNECCGLGFFRGTRSVIRNSSGSGSEFAQGMFLIASHHVRVLDNAFRNNADQAIFVNESADNLIAGNLSSRNKFGIFMEKANRNRVKGNRSVRDNEAGIYVAPGNRNLITRNRVAHNRGVGRAKGTGIEVDGGDHNVFARNWVRGTEEDAIIVGCPQCPVLVGNVVRGNHLRGAGTDGVHIDDKARRTLLRGNHARHSKADGIDVESRSTKLTKNRALRNGGLGIEAVRGVIDAGGNIARFNGNPRQCTNIVCN